MKKIAVFATGHGTNFENLCKAEKNNFLPAQISLLIAGKPGIGAIGISEDYGKSSYIFNEKDFAGKEDYEQSLLSCLQENEIDYIALAGWLKLVPPAITKHFVQRVVNIHPALLPFFGGKGMYGIHVHRAVWESGMLVSGATVHFVDDEYDHGKIILQQSVTLNHKDKPEDIAARVLQVEHRIYPLALKLLVEDKIKIINDRVIIDESEF